MVFGTLGGELRVRVRAVRPSLRLGSFVAIAMTAHRHVGEVGPRLVLFFSQFFD